MKNKKVIAIVLTALLLIPTTAFAKGPKEKDNGNGNGKGTKVETPKEKDKGKSDNGDKGKKDNTGKNDDKKAEHDAFKTQLKEKLAIMKENTKKSVELKKQIEIKGEEIAAILKDIQDGKKTLTTEQMDALLAQSEIVKADVEALNNYKYIKSDVNETEENVKGKKYEGALAALDRVIAKQQGRIVVLEKLNSDLGALLDIAKQAQVPAATPGDTQNGDNPTGTTPEGTPTTPTGDSTGTTTPPTEPEVVPAN